ncbi:hypothetical protein FLONG3_3514 [Fusarium longipes]|uniref:Uncharacterized protein n=1 Tax=Fusarium longipes TaxID=694270 RepID=A0A395T0Z0_9HYPO|nr:hypothetical protein FLONG3_3514 [Fusarium longipes]
MKFSAVIASTAIFLASGVTAWTKDAAGVWVANNTFYTIRGSTVHESCTTMNTEDVHADGDYCAYWINGIGQKHTGKCKKTGNSVFCI